MNHDVQISLTSSSALTTNVTGLPAGSAGIAITPDGARAYVGCSDAGSVAVIDTLSNTVAAIIPGVPDASYVTIAPNGALAYVTTAFNGQIVAIDTATNIVSATITVGGFQEGSALTPDGAFLWVTDPFNNNISIIETATNAVAATIASPGPSGIVIVEEATPPAPTAKDQCKNGGWMTFTNPSFNNQGECIQYVNQL